ncbi:metallophosphoesterase [Dactylosporangium fulvum]|uniref:Metallophosphoesterase n=1 Tax=Dactylosporangium fulvum TaxID=53359 RepID=A0ABY5W9A7_9ACTN|nr:metallophosphoesterase [Dactylosporangium fulvum]UWP86635.1 metallophosphoesterase [Dactylosporangium fulvum]
MLLLAHISDLHLDGSERSLDRAGKVMDYLRGLPQPADALLVTGDIADNGDEAEYEAAARLLSVPFPVLTCPGNHDIRAAYRKALTGEPVADGPINRLHRVGGLAVLMCDSTMPGRDEGLLDDETLGWLASTLDELDGAPAVVAFHHPPVQLHHPLPDSMLLQQPSALAALLGTHPNVIAILTGHAHTAAAAIFAGRPLLVAPAVTWTLRLPWESGHLADLGAPPGLAFHVLDDAGNLVTHYRVVL